MILTQPHDTPHPAGIFYGTLVAVEDLGPQETTFKGKTRKVRYVRLTFETVSGEERRRLTRTFTASLHSKSRLADFLGKWRGAPIMPGETVDLDNFLGKQAALVIAHRQREDGPGVFAVIEAASPSVASGTTARGNVR